MDGNLECLPANAVNSSITTVVKSDDYSRNDPWNVMEYGERDCNDGGHHPGQVTNKLAS